DSPIEPGHHSPRAGRGDEVLDHAVGELTRREVTRKPVVVGEPAKRLKADPPALRDVPRLDLTQAHRPCLDGRSRLAHGSSHLGWGRAGSSLAGTQPASTVATGPRAILEALEPWPRAGRLEELPVSKENVELVGRIYALWDRGESARELIDRDLEYVNPPTPPDSLVT